jgi:hypothetical protein
VGSRLVIWNGDDTGGGAQGWDSCDKKPECATKLGPDSGSGVNGSTALKFHAEGPGWLGMGWNLFGWYPETAGIDISPYSHLTFQIRVDAKSAEAAPEYLGLALGCSNKSAKDTTDVPVERYVKAYADGKWHKVEIPITALTKGAGAQFDLKAFWEFRLTHLDRDAEEFRYLHRRHRRRKAVTAAPSAQPRESNLLAHARR